MDNIDILRSWRPPASVNDIRRALPPQGDSAPPSSLSISDMVYDVLTRTDQAPFPVKLTKHSSLPPEWLGYYNLGSNIAHVTDAPSSHDVRAHEGAHGMAFNLEKSGSKSDKAVIKALTRRGEIAKNNMAAGLTAASKGKNPRPRLDLVREGKSPKEFPIYITQGEREDIGAAEAYGKSMFTPVELISTIVERIPNHPDAVDLASRWKDAVERGDIEVDPSVNLDDVRKKAYGSSTKSLTQFPADWYRRDGSLKSLKGWLGPLTLPNGQVATEYTMSFSDVLGGMDIPSLVPTLSKEEIDLMVNDIIPNGKKPPQSVINKMIEHAEMMTAYGKSVFSDN
jgi:hypothetical protein